MLAANTLLFALVAFAQNQPPVGMILMADSAVQVQRGTARTPARLGDLLYAGDRVTTGTGQVTFLYCPSSERLTAKNGMTVELGPRVANTAGLTRAAAKCALPQVALGSESLERVGGMRARGNPPIPIYLGGTIASNRPTFSWAPFPGTQQYRLSLTDADGKVLWEYRGAAPAATYPQTMPALGEGEFRWEVVAQADGKTLAEQSAPFTVKSNAELSAVPAANDAASVFLRATELENAGYLAEAAAYFRMLRDSNPGDERLSRRLVVLYWNAGLIAAVNDEMSKLGPQK